jgi:tetratricopeptide (TPR) repeat protein
MIGCADRDTWLGVLEDRVTDEDRPRLLGHLETCPACAATFASLAAEWSLATLARGHAAEGPVTRHIRAGVEEAHPGVTAARGAHAGMVPPPIPGITDLELAGRGGMGAVYRGRDTRLDRLVAVKVLAGAGMLSAEARTRAEREAWALARLDHPHIVRIHAAGEVAGLPYIVMEWIEGRTLQARIDADGVPPREAAGIALHLARALGAVHAVGIVHRDVKPGNVLLARTADPAGGEVPKLVDFGLARAEGESLTRTTAVLGTPCSMAPEQTGLEPGLGGPSTATDIHGLGATLYCMLTGSPPYAAATSGESLRRAARAEFTPLAAAAPRVPADLRTIVETCLEYQPARRYMSAAALADDLVRFLDGRPIAARPAGPIARLRGWSRRHPAAAVAAVLTGVLVAAGAGGGVIHVVRLERARAEAAASRDAAIAARDLARQSLERLTDESIAALLVRGPALGERDRDFLRSVRDEFRRWPLEPDVRAGLEVRARGLHRVATLFMQIDQLAEALECEEGVSEALDEAARRGFADAALVAWRFDALTVRRQVLQRLGRVDEALAATRAAIADLETLAAGDPMWRGKLAASLVDLALGEQSAGDRDAPHGHAARALELFAAACAAAPDDPALLHEHVRALYNTALVAHNDGRTIEHRERLERLVALCEHGRQRFPDRVAVWDRSGLLGLNGLAWLELAAGRPEAALEIVTQREALARAASSRDPDEPLFVGERVDAALQLAVCHEALGRPEASRESVESAVRLAESAVERQPAVYDRSHMLAVALSRQARMCDLLGDPAAAVAARDRLGAVLAPWRESESAAAMIAEHLVVAADTLEAQGDRAAAVLRLERALAVAPPSGRTLIESRLETLRAEP